MYQLLLRSQTYTFILSSSIVGVAVGAAVGGVVAILAAALLAIFCIRRRQKSGQKISGPTTVPPDTYNPDPRLYAAQPPSIPNPYPQNMNPAYQYNTSPGSGSEVSRTPASADMLMPSNNGRTSTSSPSSYNTYFPQAPGSATTAGTNQPLTRNQAEFVQNLHDLNFPPSAIAQVVQTMGREDGGAPMANLADFQPGNVPTGPGYLPHL
jgi:hypothetical protein